jgi:hypothetical protein
MNGNVARVFRRFCPKNDFGGAKVCFLREMNGPKRDICFKERRKNNFPFYGGLLP